MDSIIKIIDNFLGAFLLAANFLSEKFGFVSSLVIALSFLTFAVYLVFKSKKLSKGFLGSFILALISLWFTFCVLVIEGLATRNSI
jgi:heme O synthase-like polyprenyltransferase